VRRYVGLNPGRVLFRRVHRSIGPHLRVLVTGGARFDPDTNRALHASNSRTAAMSTLPSVSACTRTISIG
jgi:hypothetical protein